MESSEFRVKSEHGHQSLGFRRVIGGKDDGAVFVDYYRDGTPEALGSVVIDAAGWASVLAHLSAAEHDGNTYQVAADFHAGRIIPGEINASGKTGF
jgi:hypothetical protein